MLGIWLDHGIDALQVESLSMKLRIRIDVTNDDAYGVISSTLNCVVVVVIVVGQQLMKTGNYSTQIELALPTNRHDCHQKKRLSSVIVRRLHFGQIGKRR
jgi:hypothetical protein